MGVSLAEGQKDWNVAFTMRWPGWGVDDKTARENLGKLMMFENNMIVL